MPRFSPSYPIWRRLLIKGKKVIVSLRVLILKVVVSRVEVDQNGHVDTGEQCLATSCHLRLSLVESLMPRFLPSYPMWRLL